MPEVEIEVPSKLTRITLLGAKGAGKTCFLAGMAILSEPNRSSNFTAVRKDATTARYLENIAGALRNKSWPNPTNLNQPLHLRLEIDSQALDIMFFDYAGEDLRVALKRLEKEQIQSLYDHYMRSDAILLLFSPDQDLNAATPEERREQTERLDAHLMAISDAWAESNGSQINGRKKFLDIAVVITKCDTIPKMINSSEAERYFKARLPHLASKIQERAHCVGFFPISAVGVTEQSENGRFIPAENIVPLGYDSLFRWVLSRQNSRLWRKWMWRSVSALVVIVIACLVVWRMQEDAEARQLKILTDANQSVINRLRDTKQTDFDKVIKVRHELFNNEIEKYRTKLKDAQGEQDLQYIMSELNELMDLNPGSVLGEIEDLKTEINTRREKIAFDRVDAAFNNRSHDFLKEVADYLRDLPEGKNAIRVRELQTKWLNRIRLEARARIKHMRVFNAATLAGKSKAIIEFLQEHGENEPTEKAAMKRASDLGQKFSIPGDYTIDLKKSGGFSKAYLQDIQVYLGKNQIAVFASPAKSTEVTWPSASFKIKWMAGEDVKATLSGHGNFGVSPIGSAWDDSAIALRLFNGRREILNVEEQWKAYVNDPFIHFSVREVTTDDWKAVEAYLIPGSGW